MVIFLRQNKNEEKTIYRINTKKNYSVLPYWWVRSSEKVGGGEKQTDFVSIKTFSSVFLLNQPERVISERERASDRWVSKWRRLLTQIYTLKHIQNIVASLRLECVRADFTPQLFSVITQKETKLTDENMKCIFFEKHNKHNWQHLYTDTDTEPTLETTRKFKWNVSFACVTLFSECVCERERFKPIYRNTENNPSKSCIIP